MIVVDIGNTNIVIGLFVNQKLKNIIRLNTKDKKLIIKLENIFNSSKISKLRLENKNCIISSVSDYSEKKIINFFTKKKFNLLNVNINNIPGNIKFKYERNQLGADRIANTFAAIKKYGKNLLIIDFGTATTFDVIVNNVYEGGVISPGINISHDALVSYASKLKKISIVKIKKITGKNTKNSMQSGFYWGYTALINGVIKKIIVEKKYKPKIILTGGLSSVFKSEIKYKTYHDPNLTLEGLYLIGKKKYA
jgi:type III pantothenate kinase